MANENMENKKNTENEVSTDSNEVKDAEFEEVKSAPKKEDKKSKRKVDKKTLELAETQRDEYLAALQRERADFENFRKRNQMAVSKALSEGRADAAEQMLPVCDNLERAIASAEEDSPLKQGIEMVLRQLTDIFEKLGIEEIPATVFDPNLHNAIATVPAEEGDEDGQIKEVLMKGYKMGDRVIRHSIVKIVG